MNIKRWILLIALLAIGGCTANQREQIQEAKLNQAKEDLANVSDPFEGINRLMWDFNRDVLDRFLVKPATQAYVAITPQPIRTGLHNAALNLEEPSNLINNLLQGNPSNSFASFSRFAINSTVGVFGLIDVAGKMGIERKEEDFDHVLGSLGVGSGPYLMLPVFGPRDTREFVGDIADRFYWPESIMEDPHTIAAAVIRLLELRATLLEQEELLERSLDPYMFVRDIYFQRNAFELSDGRIGQQTEEELEEEADDFADFEAFLEGTE